MRFIKLNLDYYLPDNYKKNFYMNQYSLKIKQIANSIRLILVMNLKFSINF